MCVCDPAHLHFSLNCIPNEITKNNVSTYRSTNYQKNETIYSRGPMRPVATII